MVPALLTLGAAINTKPPSLAEPLAWVEIVAPASMLIAPGGT